MRKIALSAAVAFVVIALDAWLSIRTLSPAALARSSTFNPLIVASGTKLISRSTDYLLGPSE
jgi:hypothetical protein